jgi:anti-sigma regulatory factor (Ser/Thr protein kinase)
MHHPSARRDAHGGGVVITMVDKPSTLTPPAGHPVVTPTGPRPAADAGWFHLSPEETSAARARRRVLDVLAADGVPEDDALLGDVALVVSEAITNAVRAATRLAVERGQPWEPYEYLVGLRVVCRPAWIHLFVNDPDPREPQPQERQLLDEEGGRGFTVIDGFAAVRWFHVGQYGKTLHIIVPRHDQALSEDDIAKLKQRVIL